MLPMPNLCLFALIVWYQFFSVVDAITPGPLHTSGRWIVDSNQQRVKLRCVNWAGHLEVNIPEGLQHQPVDAITSWILDNGFNCVRLTYSIDMALNPNQTVEDSFMAAAAAAGVSPSDMQALYAQAVAKNSFLAGGTTVLQVFAAIIDSLGSKGIRVILDNHVSKASWCCSLTDGNGWWDAAPGYNSFNSQYFNTNEWLSGLSAIATFAKSHPAVVGMSLRNELRAFLLQVVSESSAWYQFVTQGAQSIHAANPDLLIVIGGWDSATNSRSLFSSPLDTSSWANRTVWEFHAYQFTVTYPNPTGSCTVADGLYGFFAGFLLEQNQPYTGPLWLSEFGVGMTGGPNQGLSDAEFAYLGCLVQYMEDNDADWAVWALQGSYYVRSQQVNYDESYGLLTPDWSTWRNPAFPGMLGGMWNVTQTP